MRPLPLLPPWPAKRVPTAAVTPAFGHSPRPSGHNYKNRKAPARRTRRHRLGTGRRRRRTVAWRRRGIGLLLLLTADQTVATMLTHNDPITSKDNPITSRNIFSLTFFNLSLELVTYTSLYKSLLEIQFYISFRQLFQARRI